MPLLEIEDLTVRYGLLPALTNVSFTLAAGETVAMIGANGAGKSTLLRAIAGIHTPTAGSIRLEGRDITHLPAHRRVAAGIVLAASPWIFGFADESANVWALHLVVGLAAIFLGLTTKQQGGYRYGKPRVAGS